MRIGNRVIGEGRPYIIAEFGVNHNGSLELAKEGIKKAAESGADAIKFQTYTADEIVCKGTPRFWEKREEEEGNDQHEAYEKIGGFPYEWYPELIRCCEENKIEFLSTAFSFEAADYLHSLGMNAFKVASSDMSHLPYLEHLAKYNKPILLSTGASTIEEIQEAVAVIRNAGNEKIVVMHCILCYPTEDKDANLKVIQTLRKAFPTLQVGLSDHTLGIMAPMIATLMGASVIEKHFTIDKNLGVTADHWLSLDPPEMVSMIGVIKTAQKMLGTGSREEIFPCEKEARRYDKRSIVSKYFIPMGTKITEDLITYKRPGTGLWPKHKDIVVGSVAKRNIPSDVPITFGMI